jgi:hypothetical protein
MNRNSILMVVGAIVLLIVAAGILAFLFLRPENEPAPPQNTGGNPFGFSTTGTEPSTGAAVRTIYSRQGEPVSVPDFTEGKESQQIGASESDVQFDLTPYPPYNPDVPYPTHAYDVQFNQANSEFVVTLNEEPLGSARRAAETFLRNILGLTDTEFCALNIVVGVPYSVNESLSYYQNLGLSFCPQAYPLP